MEEEKKRTRRKKRKRVVKPVIEQQAVAIADEGKEEKKNLPKVKRSYGKRFWLIAAAGIMMLAGGIGVVSYVFTFNMIIGVPSAMLAFGGFLLGYHAWNRDEDIYTEKHEGYTAEQVNSLNIYRDRIRFETVENPEGYPLQCINDHKPYYVHIWDEVQNKPIAFILPDQQYYDPGVFAERVIELPAHRRVCKRREKMGQHIRTALLVLTIVVLWFLIMTTTGTGG